jgi:CubicO group peptidase (beta-lactamase class C family)
VSRAGPAQTGDPLFRALDERIEAGMARYHIAGVAVGVFYQGQEYVRGYGVTNVDYPEPVDGDTLFRIASTTKTFTGTTVMLLVEQGLLDLDAPVRRYLPDFRVADEAASERVTLRQCLNDSAGWVGDDWRAIRSPAATAWSTTRRCSSPSYGTFHVRGIPTGVSSPAPAPSFAGRGFIWATDAPPTGPGCSRSRRWWRCAPTPARAARWGPRSMALA